MNPTILCLSILLFATTCFAQAPYPINSFPSALGSEYAIVEDPSFDDSATGANAVWTFNSFTATGIKTIDTRTSPTAQQLIDFPLTTHVLNTTRSSDGFINSTFVNGIGPGNVSAIGFSFIYPITVAYLSRIYLSPVNDIFPLNFQYLNPQLTSGDTVPTAGSSPFWTGFRVIIVDAYGKLSMNDVGGGAYTNVDVTRLTISEQFSDTVSATLTITTRYYFRSNGDLLLRTTKITDPVNAAQIPTDEFIIETLIDSVLDDEDQNSIINDINISPNPVKNRLNIKLSNNQQIQSVHVIDMLGRKVMSVNGNDTSIAVANLKPGVYIAKIKTGNNMVSQKFIKE